MLVVHWGVDGRSPVKLRLEGLEVTVPNLKQGESHQKEKTPGDMQSVSQKPRLLRKAAGGTWHR